MSAAAMTANMHVAIRPAFTSLLSGHPKEGSLPLGGTKARSTKVALIPISSCCPDVPAVCRSREFHRGAHGTGTIMPRGQQDLTTALATHHPLDLQPIVRNVVIGPE